MPAKTSPSPFTPRYAHERARTAPFFLLLFLCLLCACLAAVLARSNRELSLLLSLAAAALVLGRLAAVWNERFAPVWQSLAGNGELLPTLWKGAMLCIVTHLAAACCLDTGQRALAAAVELAGKTAVLLTALPMLTELGSLIGTLAGK